MVVEIEAPAEHRIPEERWGDFTAKFEKLAKRARKLGVGDVTFEVVRVERMQRVRFDALAFLPDAPPEDAFIAEGAPLPERSYLIGNSTFRTVRVAGDRPKLNGWRFVGTLQSLKDDENRVINILRAAPGEVIPPQYRKAEQWCDQCRTRRYRIDTYIVQHDDGRTAQVGSDCLRDFLGHANPETIARFCEYLIELDSLAGSEGNGGGSGEGALYLPYILELTAARVRVKGWMSRSKAREINGEADAYNEEVYANDLAVQEGAKLEDGAKVGRKRGVEATADAVSLYLDKKLGQREMVRDGVGITDADKVEAESALEWIRAQDYERLQNGTSDYMWNLYAACARSDMSYRTLGIVCSLIAAYQREMGRQAERKARNAKWANSQFIGEVKRREVFELKLTAEPQHYANDFGGSYLYRLEDRDGNQVVWWASNLLMINEATREAGQDAEFWSVDQWLSIKATVVKHEERNGVKQTTINRAAIDVPKPAKVKRSK